MVSPVNPRITLQAMLAKLLSETSFGMQLRNKNCRRPPRFTWSCLFFVVSTVNYFSERGVKERERERERERGGGGEGRGMRGVKGRG